MTWKLINKENGISNIIDEDIEIKEILLSEFKEYDYKIVGSKIYDINIIEMDFKYKMLYAEVKQ